MRAKKEFDLHRQKLDYTCMHGTFLMLYEKHGKPPIKELDLLDETGDNPEGYSWEAGLENLKNHGLVGELKRDATYEDLLYNKDKSLIVCYITSRTGEPDYHFSLVYQIDDLAIHLADPSFGDIYSYSRNEFERIWEDEEGKRNFIAVQNPNPSDLKAS